MRKPTQFQSLLRVLAPAVLLWGASSKAAIITFADPTFADSNWSLATQLLQNGGSATANQLSTFGNPSPCRQVNISVNAGSDTAVYAFSLTNQAQYNPSTQSAITLLTYGEDRNTTGAGQEYGPALLQGGIYYYSDAGYGATTGWQSPVNTSFTSSSFTTANGTGTPNFTATGGPITFGFVSINNTTAQSFNTTGYYDNWTITLTTTSVPEPASVTLVLIASGTIFCWRFRTKSFSQRAAG